MSIDMSQFYQVFFEEAEEHLATMESLLLALDAAAPSPDDLNAIFRAAHSIKGGSGTFGFTDMTVVTHELETLLDRLRKQELQLTAPMVDAFLEARDVIRAQLDVHRAGGGTAVDAAPVCAKLKALTEDPRPAPAAAVTAAAFPGSPEPAGGDCLDIEFTPASADVSLDSLFESLCGVGEMTITARPAAAVAGDSGGGAWRLRLKTAAEPEKVRELFGFVAAPEALRIVSQAETAPQSGDAGFGFFDDVPGGPGVAAATAQSDPGYGFFGDAPVSAPAAAPAPALAAAPAPEPGPDRRAGAPPTNFGRRATDRPGGAGAESTSIRVSIEKVDTLINLVGELVITQAMLAQMAAATDAVLHEKLLNGLALLDRNTRDLQESVMSIRMMPMSFVFSRFPRVVRDLAGKLGKQVELRTEGEGTELDKGLIEKLADPLTHLVRNSLDHGLEMPGQRIAAGKPAKGVITLRAFHKGGNIFVEVADDGAGLNREKILAKARERGLQVSDTIGDQEIYQLIFEAGFSTAEKVTDVSGRGVGMDVVRRNIREMGGSVEISSKIDHGTCISIRLPLTLAILDGLSVAVGDETFIVPLAHIIESLQPAAADIKTVSGSAQLVHVRGEYLPVVALHETLGIRPRVTDPHAGIMVILESEGTKTALLVDELLGQHQVVIKSLETNYKRVPGVSGATIMGDGRVALILDAAGIVGASRQKLARAA